MISFNDIFNKLTSSKTYTDLFTDPLKVALITTAIILLIVYLIFKDEIDEDTSSSGFFNIFIKTAVYVAIANIAMVFIFHGSISSKLEDKNKSQNDSEAVRATLAPTPPVYVPTPPPVVQPTPPVVQPPAQPQ